MRGLWAVVVVACVAPKPRVVVVAPPPAAANPKELPMSPPARQSLADMWHWHCCNGRYTGGLAFTQSGTDLRGIFLADQGMGTYVDGNVDGQRVVFTRRWLNAGRLYSQIYTLTSSADGQRLSGSFVETHAPGPPIDFSAERRFQPELHDFGGAPVGIAKPVTEPLGRTDAQGRFLPPDCDCSHPCGCSGIPALMECHSACGCPACPPGIP